MTQRYGPWIEHDGKGFPKKIIVAEQANGAKKIRYTYSRESGGRNETPWEQANPGRVDPKSPSWTWRWRGGVFTRRRRVCADPEYMPLIKYRFVYDDPRAASQQVEMLRDIAAGKREPAPEPQAKEAVQDD